MPYCNFYVMSLLCSMSHENNDNYDSVICLTILYLLTLTHIFYLSWPFFISLCPKSSVMTDIDPFKQVDHNLTSNLWRLLFDCVTLEAACICCMSSTCNSQAIPPHLWDTGAFLLFPSLFLSKKKGTEPSPLPYVRGLELIRAFSLRRLNLQ